MSEQLQIQPVMTPLKAIRAKCCDCMCWQKAEVRRCDNRTCTLWPYRMGRRPGAAPGGEEGLDS